MCGRRGKGGLETRERGGGEGRRGKERVEGEKAREGVERGGRGEVGGGLVGLAPVSPHIGFL